MMVPRAFRYTAMPDFDEKTKDMRSATPRKKSVRRETSPAARPEIPVRSRTEPVRAPTPPMPVPTPERKPSATRQRHPPVQHRASSSSTKRATPHDPNALPPAVAALLAVTQIPRPKPNQFRRRSSTPRRISIDELVSEWKSEGSLGSSYSKSPALNVLLEGDDDQDGESDAQADAAEAQLNTRSTSLESVPSLDDDSRSFVSNGSLRTPESLRSRRSTSNLKKDKSRSLPMAVSCEEDHPLVARRIEDEESDESPLMDLRRGSGATTPRARATFKSNLTTSLQALKKAAKSSFSSFTLSSVSPAQRTSPSLLSDDMLWSHPFLFPRLSSEVRPAIEGTPTKAQRRYLNPMPLTFEEQEAPYQLALHAPFLAERVEGAPSIQMQTYERGRRKSGAKRRGSPDPQSEAGRALAAPTGVRQREPRENSDFLRVVVLEMNMRRVGKLEYGRAKIWLPPRQITASADATVGIPRRWVGESAY